MNINNIQLFNYPSILSMLSGGLLALVAIEAACQATRDFGELILSTCKIFEQHIDTHTNSPQSPDSSLYKKKQVNALKSLSLNLLSAVFTGVCATNVIPGSAVAANLIFMLYARQKAGKPNTFYITQIVGRPIRILTTSKAIKIVKCVSSKALAVLKKIASICLTGIKQTGKSIMVTARAIQKFCHAIFKFVVKPFILISKVAIRAIELVGQVLFKMLKGIASHPKAAIAIIGTIALGSLGYVVGSTLVHGIITVYNNTSVITTLGQSILKVASLGIKCMASFI